MFDGLNDDDDAFFTPVGSSNLASLFGVANTQAKASSTKTTLTYTAPKQPPSKTEEIAKNSNIKHQSSVILFKEVHAFKVVEKNYLNQGKCGLALIGNDNVQIYQLLLYKQKNDIISTTKVCNQFQFLIQKDNYASYSDDQKQSWTAHFSSELELTEFYFALESRGGKIVKLSNCETNIVSTPVSPKLTEKKVDEELPKQIESSNQSDASSSNVKANILSRMAKMGQKLLPNTSISDGTDSETEREKSMHNKNRKTKRGTISSPTSSTSTTEVTKQLENVSPNRTSTVSLHGPSYVQSLTPQYTIINGQPVPVTQIGSEYNSPCQSALSVDNLPSPVMYTQLIPPPFDQLQMYFTENRTHNSEVRMNILRMTNKMEEVLEKVQKMNTCSEKGDYKICIKLKEENENLKSIILKLENDIVTNKDAYRSQSMKLTENVWSLRMENEELKKQITSHILQGNECNRKIDEMECKIKEFEETSATKTEVDDKLVNKENKKAEEMIKKIMNSLYSEISEQFQDDEAIQGKDVKKILAQKIVDNTYSIILAVCEMNLSK